MEKKRSPGRMECVRAACSRVAISSAPQTLLGNWNRSQFTDGKVEVLGWGGSYIVDQYPLVSKWEPEPPQIPELSSHHRTELSLRKKQGRRRRCRREKGQLGLRRSRSRR